jgi:hypothetical protein
MKAPDQQILPRASQTRSRSSVATCEQLRTDRRRRQHFLRLREWQEERATAAGPQNIISPKYKTSNFTSKNKTIGKTGIRYLGSNILSRNETK